MSDKPRWISRLAVESVVVVFSILLALAADEWRREREIEERVDRAVEAMRAELADNADRLRVAARYHRQVGDTLMALAARGAREFDVERVRPRGWLMTPDLLVTSWETAEATGTTGAIDYGVARILAQAYREQEEYLSQRRTVSSNFHLAVLLQGMDVLLANPDRLAGLIRDVAAWEENLLATYDRALESLSSEAR